MDAGLAQWRPGLVLRKGLARVPGSRTGVKFWHGAAHHAGVGIVLKCVSLGPAQKIDFSKKRILSSFREWEVAYKSLPSMGVDLLSDDKLVCGEEGEQLHQGLVVQVLQTDLEEKKYSQCAETTT
jgi:hypothetical protein